MARRTRPREKAKQSSSRLKRENPAAAMLYHAKARAKAKGLEFNLDVKDLLPLPTFCPVYGARLVYDGDRQQDASASLDRIENDKGYVRGNVAIISMKANWDKQACSLDRLRVRLVEIERKLIETRALISYVSARTKD